MVFYSGHGSNNDLIPGIWIANKWKLLFSCFCYLDVRYSDPHCITISMCECEYLKSDIRTSNLNIHTCLVGFSICYLHENRHVGSERTQNKQTWLWCLNIVFSTGLFFKRISGLWRQESQLCSNPRWTWRTAKKTTQFRKWKSHSTHCFSRITNCFNDFSATKYGGNWIYDKRLV